MFPTCNDDVTLFIGLEFWRCGSRKVYAVLEKNLRCVNKGKFAADTSASSDDSDHPTSKMKPKADVSKDIKEIKSSIEKLFSVQKTMKVPIGLRQTLNECFKCTVCQDVITPPVIFSRCCRFVIGCETCIDQWYEDRAKKCPRCRQERGYSETCRLNGLDEFLQAIKTLLAE